MNRVGCAHAAALLLVVLAACSTSTRETAPAKGDPASAVAWGRASGPLARPEWQREITHRTGSPFRPIAFRAGGGIASLLQGPPLRHWMALLADSGHIGAGGPSEPHVVRELHGLGAPTDIVAVAADGYSWYLDPVRSRVVGENVGGEQITVASLGVRGTVRTACGLGERAIAFLDTARPGRVFVRELAPPYATRELPFPDGLLGRHVRWQDLRFGGSAEGPCVLFARAMRGVVVVSDSSARAISPFVEPLSRVDALYARGAWYAPLAGLIAWRERGVGALDATSVPGGVAVLFEGRTAAAGRLVDFYSDSGVYLETLHLPRRARRIAATPHRLIVLSAPDDRTFIASYLLPTGIRRRAAAAEPVVIAPPGPGTEVGPTVGGHGR